MHDQGTESTTQLLNIGLAYRGKFRKFRNEEMGYLLATGREISSFLVKESRDHLFRKIKAPKSIVYWEYEGAMGGALFPTPPPTPGV